MEHVSHTKFHNIHTRLINPHIKDNNAAVRVKGSSNASIILPKSNESMGQGRSHLVRSKSSGDDIERVNKSFPRMLESDLHSSKKKSQRHGRGGTPDTAPVGRTPGVGGKNVYERERFERECWVPIDKCQRLSISSPESLRCFLTSALRISWRHAKNTWQEDKAGS